MSSRLTRQTSVTVAGGELAVAVGHAAGGVRRPANGDAPVPDVDVGMVILALGELGEAVDEGNRRREALELELADECVVVLAPALGNTHPADYA